MAAACEVCPSGPTSSVVESSCLAVATGRPWRQHARCVPADRRRRLAPGRRNGRDPGTTRVRIPPAAPNPALGRQHQAGATAATPVLPGCESRRLRPTQRLAGSTRPAGCSLEMELVGLLADRPGGCRSCLYHFVEEDAAWKWNSSVCSRIALGAADLACITSSKRMQPERVQAGSRVSSRCTFIDHARVRMLAAADVARTSWQPGFQQVHVHRPRAGEDARGSGCSAYKLGMQRPPSCMPRAVRSDGVRGPQVGRKAHGHAATAIMHAPGRPIGRRSWSASRAESPWACSDADKIAAQRPWSSESRPRR